MRKYIEERKRFDQEFATFAKISSRVELCKRLSAEFGWTVDHYALGRSTGFLTGRKNAPEMYEEKPDGIRHNKHRKRHSMPGNKPRGHYPRMCTKTPF